MDDIERAIDDAVNVYRCMSVNGRFGPGAGCLEIKLSSMLEEEGKKNIKGLDRYAYLKFAEAFQIIPRILSNNCGQDSTEIITKMTSKNREGFYGLDVESGDVV